MSVERLTIRNSDGSVSQPTDLRWGDALKKLAQYEDTGMTPPEILDMKEMFHAYRHVCGGVTPERLKELVEADRKGWCCIAHPDPVGEPGVRGISIEQEKRMDEILDADRDGRCVVLPCKIGDTIYAVSLGKVRELRVVSIPYFLSEVTNHLTINAMNNRGAIISVESWQFGKTVFLSREEAEKALEEQHGNGN